MKSVEYKLTLIILIVVFINIFEKHFVSGQDKKRQRHYWSYYQRDGAGSRNGSRPNVNLLRG